MDEQSFSRHQQSQPYLSPNQQSLLLAALRSQTKTTSAVDSISAETSTVTKPSPAMNGTGTFSAAADSADLDTFGDEYTPDLDYLDGDTSYDFENADLGGEMIGALPGSGLDTNGDGHEKRKNPDDEGDYEDGDAKRQDTQEGEKGAKKPGRKPLTSEPTTKRKAQNRAAQRAFRERKEKHLKDLETKVSELTKASEADKHENGLLKAQVDRLQTELREYRKRLALNGTGAGQSSSPSATNTRSNGGPSANSVFSFDFPKFGSLPGSQVFGLSTADTTNSAASTYRSSSSPSNKQSPPSFGGSLTQSPPTDPSIAEGLSPDHLRRTVAQKDHGNQQFSMFSTTQNMHGFGDTLSKGVTDPLGDLFSPSILKSASVDSYFESPGAQATSGVNAGASAYNADNGGDNSAGLNRVFQFNSGSSVSDSTSPSASTPSQWNGNVASNSSCGTSPEPVHDSPANKDNTRHSFDRNSQSLQTKDAAQPILADPNNSAFSFGASDYSMPSMSSFDPVLFGEYRDSQDAIVGDGEFNNGFFDDSLVSAPFDYASPSNLFGILQTPQPSGTAFNNAPSPLPPSKGLMAEIDKTRDGGDDGYRLGGEKRSGADGKEDPKFVSCNHIWSQLQSNPNFQEGKFDLDNLCSELRQKARCSESGVMVEQSHVDAALRRLGQKDENGAPQKALMGLMFEQKSWDNVLARLGAN